MRYELKPLGVGGILDQTILILKDRFGLFLIIVLCLRVPAIAILQYVLVTHQVEMPPQANDAQVSEFFSRVMHLWFVVLLPWILINALVIAPLTDGALIHAAARTYLGQSTRVGESFRMALARYFSYVWTSTLLGFLVLAGTACCVLPGILLFFRFALALSVTVLERDSGLAAMQRSRVLMHFDRTTNYNTLFLLLVVLFLIQAGISGGATFIGQVYLQVLVNAVLQSIAYAFSIIAFVVFYYSCRCRAEGFDLLHLARIVADTPADEPTLASQE